MTEDDKDFEARLGQAIRQLAKERVFVPASKDEKIIGGIRNRLERRNRELGKVKAPAKRTPKLSRWQKWMPLAASILIAASIFYFSIPQRSVADLNGDGKVDVIDALILANQLKSGAIHEADVNGDGAVDQKDVQEIASRSVHLDEREQL